ncbi:hypothetical protein [Streptomyces humi]
MSRTRTAFGLLVVAVGTAWLYGGPEAVRAGAHVVLVAGPYALMAFAVLLVLRAALPKGAALGPLVLFLAGGVWAVAGQGRIGNAWESRVVPLSLIALGALVALSRSVGTHADGISVPIRRYGSWFVPRQATLLPSESGVRRIVARAVFGTLRVDLSQASFPDGDDSTGVGVLHADVTVLFGRVEFVLGQDCAVVLARDIHTYGTSLTERVPVFVNTAAFRRRRAATLGRRVDISLIGLGGAVALDPV